MAVIDSTNHLDLMPKKSKNIWGDRDKHMTQKIRELADGMII